MFSLENEVQNGKRYKKGASDDGYYEQNALQTAAALVKTSVSTASSEKTSAVGRAPLEQY